MREFTARTMTQLRNAQAELVEEAGVARTMELTARSKSVVYRWGDGASPDLMNVADAMKVEGYVRRPVVSQLMVGFLGGEISRGEMAAPREGTLSLHVAGLVELASTLVVETAKAKADGIVTVAEAQRLLALMASVKQLVPVIEDMLAGVQTDGPLRVVRPA